MDDIKCRPLEINTQGRHMVYRQKWDKGWWYRTPPLVQFVMLFLHDKADSVGCVDPANIDDFNYLIIKNEEQFLKEDYVLKEANELRKQIRKLDNGMWLLEDYYMSQQGSTKIDCSKGVERNDMTGGVQKGIYRACTRNGVDPASIRGLLEYIPPAKDRPHTDEEYLEALRENS